MKTDRVLDYLCTRGRRIMLGVDESESPTAMILSSCVAATKVGAEVLRYFGIEAKPVGVTTTVMNAAMADNFRSNPGPLSDEEVEQLRQQGAWMLDFEGSGAVDDNHPLGRRWDGHLVLVVEGERLVDLSADQFCRPTKGITMAPFHAPWAGWPALYGNAEGCVALYQPLEGAAAHSWRQAGDWRQGQLWRPIASVLIRELREAWPEAEQRL